jgi:hypothetical protein
MNPLSRDSRDKAGSLVSEARPISFTEMLNPVVRFLKDGNDVEDNQVGGLGPWAYDLGVGHSEIPKVSFQTIWIQPLIRATRPKLILFNMESSPVKWRLRLGYRLYLNR